MCWAHLGHFGCPGPVLGLVAQPARCALRHLGHFGGAVHHFLQRAPVLLRHNVVLTLWVACAVVLTWRVAAPADQHLGAVGAGEWPGAVDQIPVRAGAGGHRAVVAAPARLAPPHPPPRRAVGGGMPPWPCARRIFTGCRPRAGCLLPTRAAPLWVQPWRSAARGRGAGVHARLVAEPGAARVAAVGVCAGLAALRASVQRR